MEKLDLKKELKAFYNPTAKEVTLINVPKMNFIMIDGKARRKANNSPNQFKPFIPLLTPLNSIRKRQTAPILQ